MARVVALWAGPRNGSTATMYSFAQRSDTRVMDEPLFGHFLAHTGVERPSREDVLNTMPKSRDDVLQSIEPKEEDDVLFLKHMANHIEGLAWHDVDGPKHKHVILTRHPDGVLHSYRQHIAEPTMLDLSYAHQRRIAQLGGDDVIVVTAESLFQEPESTLRALCLSLELPWEPEMMTWRSGGRKEDGVWAKHWYSSLHASTGWQPRTLTNADVPSGLKKLRETCLEHYIALKAKSLNH